MTDHPILIVDDEPNVRLVFRTALEASGHEVVESGDGLEALSVLEDRPIELVLLDLRMPALDGMETLRRMRERGLNHPVIVVTAHGSIPDAVEAMRLGAIDFLSKPVTPGALRRAVDEVLDRRRPGEQGDPAELIRQAKLAISRREFEQLGPLLDRAIDMDVDTADLHYFRGLMLEMRGEAGQARRVYEAALAEDPDHEAARRRLDLLPQT